MGDPSHVIHTEFALAPAASIASVHRPDHHASILTPNHAQTSVLAQLRMQRQTAEPFRVSIRGRSHL